MRLCFLLCLLGAVLLGTGCSTFRRDPFAAQESARLVIERSLAANSATRSDPFYPALWEEWGDVVHVERKVAEDVAAGAVPPGQAFPALVALGDCRRLFGQADASGFGRWRDMTGQETWVWYARGLGIEFDDAALSAFWARADEWSEISRRRFEAADSGDVEAEEECVRLLAEYEPEAGPFLEPRHIQAILDSARAVWAGVDAGRCPLAGRLAARARDEAARAGKTMPGDRYASFMWAADALTSARSAAALCAAEASP